MENTQLLRRQSLETLLTEIAEHHYLPSVLVLQGGAALHFVYGSPRHPSDADFVSDALPIESSRIVDAFESLAYTKLVSSFRTHVGPHHRLLRFSFGLGANLPSTHVEVYGQTCLVEPRHVSRRHAALLVEDPLELYADKILATLSRYRTRGSIKGSDLYDLSYLMTLTTPACSHLLQDKARAYGEDDHVLSPDYLRAVADHIRSPAHRDDITSSFNHLLPPDVFSAIDFSDAYFAQVAWHFTQYLDHDGVSAKPL